MKKGAYQIDAQILFNYMLKSNRSSKRDHVSIVLFVSQMSLSPHRKTAQSSAVSYANFVCEF